MVRPLSAATAACVVDHAGVAALSQASPRRWSTKEEEENMRDISEHFAQMLGPAS